MQKKNITMASATLMYTLLAMDIEKSRYIVEISLIREHIGNIGQGNLDTTPCCNCTLKGQTYRRDKSSRKKTLERTAKATLLGHLVRN